MTTPTPDEWINLADHGHRFPDEQTFNAFLNAQTEVYNRYDGKSDDNAKEHQRVLLDEFLRTGEFPSPRPLPNADLTLTELLTPSGPNETVGSNEVVRLGNLLVDNRIFSEFKTAVEHIATADNDIMCSMLHLLRTSTETKVVKTFGANNADLADPDIPGNIDTINWNVKEMLFSKMPQGATPLSSAVALVHELAHVIHGKVSTVDMLVRKGTPSEAYTNHAEKYVMDYFETPVMQKLGFIPRSTHKDGVSIKCKDVTSTQLVLSKEEGFVMWVTGPQVEVTKTTGTIVEVEEGYARISLETSEGQRTNYTFKEIKNALSLTEACAALSPDDEPKDATWLLTHAMLKNDEVTIELTGEGQFVYENHDHWLRIAAQKGVTSEELFEENKTAWNMSSPGKFSSNIRGAVNVIEAQSTSNTAPDIRDVLQSKIVLEPKKAKVQKDQITVLKAGVGTYEKFFKGKALYETGVGDDRTIFFLDPNKRATFIQATAKQLGSLNIQLGRTYSVHVQSHNAALKPETSTLAPTASGSAIQPTTVNTLSVTDIKNQLRKDVLQAYAITGRSKKSNDDFDFSIKQAGEGEYKNSFKGQFLGKINGNGNFYFYDVSKKNPIAIEVSRSQLDPALIASLESNPRKIVYTVQIQTPKQDKTHTAKKGGGIGGV